jgi:hypothetical protein
MQMTVICSRAGWVQAMVNWCWGTIKGFGVYFNKTMEEVFAFIV